MDDGTADYEGEMHRASLKAFALNFGRVADSAETVITTVDRGGSI